MSAAFPKLKTITVALKTLLDDIYDLLQTVDGKVDQALGDLLTIDGKCDTIIADVGTVDGKADTIIADIGTVDGKCDTIMASTDTLEASEAQNWKYVRIHAAPVNQVVFDTAAADKNLGNLTLTGALPMGAAIKRVTGYIIADRVSDLSGSTNYLDTCNGFQVKKSTDAVWYTTHAMGNLYAFACNNNDRPGTEMRGDTDISAALTALSGTYQAKLASAKALGNSVYLNCVQWGLDIWYV